jgi:hypothetical protein
MTIDKATTRHMVFVSAYKENRNEKYFHPLKGFLQGMWKHMVQNQRNGCVMNILILFTRFII